MKSITEIKYIGLTEEYIKFETRACLLDPPNQAVVFYKVEKEWKHSEHEILIRPGTYSFGYFWRDKNYNVYHFVSAEGQSLGFYINIAADTLITSNCIQWRDLYVDVWIDVDGNIAVLDEKEVPASFDDGLVQLINNVKESLLQDKHNLWEDIEKQSREYIIRYLKSCNQ